MPEYPPIPPLPNNPPQPEGAWWGRPLLNALGIGREVDPLSDKGIRRRYQSLSTIEGLGERAVQLGNDWVEMCQKHVLPVLRSEDVPYTHHTLSYIAQFGHGMINRNPAARHSKLPEDWRLSFFLGWHTDKNQHSSQHREKVTSRAALVAFDPDTQANQAMRIRNLNGKMKDVAPPLLEKFKKEHLKPMQVRSIWVGALRESTIKPYIKVTNPYLPPEELLSINAFRRLALGDLEHDAVDDPENFIVETYCTPKAIVEQRNNIERMAEWADRRFKGEPPHPERRRIGP